MGLHRFPQFQHFLSLSSLLTNSLIFVNGQCPSYVNGSDSGIILSIDQTLLIRLPLWQLGDWSGVCLFVKFCSLLPSLDFSLWVMFDSVAGSVELKWVLFVSCYEFGLGFRFEVFVSLWIWGNVLETSTVIQLGFLIIVFRWSVCVWLYDRLRWPPLILRMWVALLSFSMFLLS